MSHTSLKRRIRAVLKVRGCLLWANPQGGGILDLSILTPDGKYLEVDVKVGADRLSPLQRHRIVQLTERGVAAGEVRSVAEALEMAGLD